MRIMEVITLLLTILLLIYLVVSKKSINFAAVFNNKTK